MVRGKIAARPSDRGVLVLLILLLITGVVVRVEILHIMSCVRCGDGGCGGSRVLPAEWWKTAVHRINVGVRVIGCPRLLRLEIFWPAIGYILPVVRTAEIGREGWQWWHYFCGLRGRDRDGRRRGRTAVARRRTCA